MRTAYSGRQLWLSLGVSLLWLGSMKCLGQGSKPSLERQQSLAAVSCKALKGLEIPASALSLPTTGANVWYAKPKRSGPISYCKVLGGISPIDPDAQDIRFEVNLPVAWNGKAVQFGGAVFDGTLGYSNGLKQPTIGPKEGLTPLQRGYTTFGSDSGHHQHHVLLPDVINVLNGHFGSNKEERTNFTADSLKKTYDVAMLLMERQYQRRSERTFFLGSSTGGHEALEVVQNWPEDYDGVMSGYPSWDGLELELQFLRTSKALYAKGGFLPRSSTKLLAKSVMRTCDSLDGLSDGLISDAQACHFDPGTLLCNHKAQHGCLSPQQLATVQAFATEQKTAQVYKNGVQSIAGYNVLAGADLTGTLGFFHHPQRHPQILLNSSQYTIGSRVLRHFIVNLEDFDALSFDVTGKGGYGKELAATSENYDVSNPDLSRFAAHGGKLLLLHGTSDTIIPTGSSVSYYERVQASMGSAAVDRFMRLYLIPGFGHGSGKFQAGVDAITLLDDWNGSGVLAANPIAVDKTRAGHKRTRPLCPFPTFARYAGSGDPALASSFHCDR